MKHRQGIRVGGGVATNLAALSDDTYVDYSRYFGGEEPDEPAPAAALRITVHGDPITQGSMRAFARGGRAIVTHDKGPALNHWRSQVTLEARRAWGRAGPLDGPVEVTLVFRLARPKSHYGTGRNAQRLKPSAPALPHTGLDLDKLARAINDALTQARIWTDDNRVCTMTTHKVYAGPGQQPGVDIHVVPLTCDHEGQLAA